MAVILEEGLACGGGDFWCCTVCLKHNNEWSVTLAILIVVLLLPWAPFDLSSMDLWNQSCSSGWLSCTVRQGSLFLSMWITHGSTQWQIYVFIFYCFVVYICCGWCCHVLGTTATCVNIRWIEYHTTTLILLVLVVVVVSGLLNIPTTCRMYFRMDLLRQLCVLKHWDSSCTSHLQSHLVTVYWHWARKA